MMIFRRFIAGISDLRVAIVLLLVIAIASGLGTSIPQGEPSSRYLEIYSDKPWLGFMHGPMVLQLQLDHVYTSSWFLALLAWLGLALMVCSWRRQWPALQAALRWIDYREPRQLSKLALAETIPSDPESEDLDHLASYLKQQGWQVQQQQERLAARRGVIGRVGPLLVHVGLVVLMIGAVWGALAGHRLEQFLAPGRSLELLNRDGVNEITLSLESFGIERDPAGRPEQFRSQLKLLESGQTSSSLHEISVNHPLRFHGMTIYQADWSLVAITLKLGRSPKLQLPLRSFPELGEQIWGIVIPTRPDGSEPILLSLSNETGPVQAFDGNGEQLASLRPGGPAIEVKGLPIQVVDVLPASGLLLKRDPGVPLVYLGFGVTLIGGALSTIATRQLWAVADKEASCLHVGGLCNRNLAGFANEIPNLLEAIPSRARAQQG
ncbi:MAG: cytochrome C biogenesis protein CcsB [Prochlorococcus sp.]|nr:cytochrome C biogenesis protein CcsB [Prochlorococcus sp.]CAI8166537.1 MAG: Cytochrome c biogenesis protein CcsB [Prochlorococcus marinus str. MIT 9215]